MFVLQLIPTDAILKISGFYFKQKAGNEFALRFLGSGMGIRGKHKTSIYNTKVVKFQMRSEFLNDYLTINAIAFIF